MSGPKKLDTLDDVDLSELKGIPGYPGYFINVDGEVFCIRRLKPLRMKDGYLRVCLYVNRKKKKPGIHALLAKTFLPSPLCGQNEVRHLDGNINNNALTNLAWGTRKQNAEDMARHGSVRGEKNPRSILKEEDIPTVFRLWRERVKIRHIANRMGVSISTIKAVLEGRNWGHLGLSRSKQKESNHDA